MFKVLLFTFLPLSLLGQNQFSWGLSLNTQVSSMKMEEKNIERFISRTTEYGGKGWGYKAGIQLQYDFNKSSALRVGVQYQRQQHVYVTYEEHITIPNLKGGDILSISSIGIPLDYIYYIPNDNKKIKFLIGANGTFHLNLKNFVNKSEINTNRSDYTLDDSLYSVGILGGLEVSFSENFSLGIEPNITYIPNTFILTNHQSTARTAFESGLTLRLRFK